MFKGRTFSSNRLPCDTVSAGAFFPQTPLHMPEKKMRQHTRQHMVMPPRIFAQCIVSHTQLGFGLFTTLFDGPPHPTQPDTHAQRRTHRRMTDVVPIRRLCPQGAFDHQPDRMGRLVICAQGHPLTGTLIHDGAFGTFRHRASIPRPWANLLCQLRDALRGCLWRGDHALRAALAFLGRACCRRGHGSEPTAGLFRHGDACHRAHTRLTRRPELWTVTIEAIGRHRAKRQGPALMETTHPIRRHVRLGVQDRLLGHVALGSAARIGVAPPLLRQEKSFVDQSIALP